MSNTGKFLLLAEDDPFVAELILHALARKESPPRVVHVRDGVEALDFLYAREGFADREPGNPALVLLDIKMPRLDGLEVLRRIKADETLRSTPVVMLTSSHEDRDIAASYGLGANAYVEKPVQFQHLVGMLATLVTFWIDINQLPTEGANALDARNPV